MGKLIYFQATVTDVKDYWANSGEMCIKMRLSTGAFHIVGADNTLPQTRKLREDLAIFGLACDFDEQAKNMWLKAKAAHIPLWWRAETRSAPNEAIYVTLTFLGIFREDT